MTDEELERTELTRLRRAPERGRFDRKTLYEIIDSTPICHLGYVVDGRPAVIPTIHWRMGDRIYWHGSRLSRSLLGSQGSEVSLTVTQLDGLVLARSAFHHSANYRSVMIFGSPEQVAGDEEKTEALRGLVDGLFDDRWQTLREMSRKELNATTVLTMEITEASAKVRAGPPKDHVGDEGLPVWAGVIPIHSVTGAPEPCPHNGPDLTVPDHVRDFILGDPEQ